MSEKPVPIKDQDDTEGHCLGIKLSNLEAERELGLSVRIPRARDAEVNRAESGDSEGRLSGVRTSNQTESDEVSGHLPPPRNLDR